VSDAHQSTGQSTKSRRVLVVAGSLLIVVALVVSVALRKRAAQLPLRVVPEPRERLDTPYIPSPVPVVQTMVEMADLQADDVVYDLGCGDGRILIAAARQAGCRGIGFDIDPKLVRQARENVRDAGLADLITIEQRDVLTVDLSQADVVMVYLLPWILERLIPQFDQLQPGSRIVSHDFVIAGCRPDKTVSIPTGGPDDQTHFVHLWIAPLKKGTAPK
jgi:SAM-dependent methyltransferase